MQDITIDINTIPADVWLCIFEHLTPSSLSSLAQTCSAFHRLTHRCLLRDIRWTNVQAALRNVEDWRGDWKQWCAIPRTLTIKLPFEDKTAKSGSTWVATPSRVRSSLSMFSRAEVLMNGWTVATHQRIAIQHNPPPTSLLHPPPIPHLNKHTHHTRPLPDPRIALPFATHPFHNTKHVLTHRYMGRLHPHASPLRHRHPPLRTLRIHRRFRFFKSVNQRTHTRDVQGFHGPPGAVTSFQPHHLLLTHLAHLNMRRIVPSLPARPHFSLSLLFLHLARPPIPILALTNGLADYPIDIADRH